MADEAKLIAIVEANTRQFENALKRLEGVTKNSTDRMTRSVKQMDSTFASLDKRVGGLGGTIGKLGRGFTGAALVGALAKIVQTTVAMNDELRKQGKYSDETAQSIDELGRAWGRAQAAMQEARATIVSELAPAIGVAGTATQLFLNDVTLLVQALDKLAHGDWKAGLDLLSGGRGSATYAGDRIAGVPGAVPGMPPNASAAMRLIAQEEGFRAKAYWDVNAYRVGFGSSTTTKPLTMGLNQVAEVTRDTTVSVADAFTDLERRIIEFQHVIEAQIGPDVFRQLPAGAQTALTSVAYNYGQLPPSVAKAARNMNVAGIANAIQALPANPARRQREARVALGDTPAGDFLEQQIEAQKKKAEEAAKISADAQEKELKRLNELEAERNKLVFERALKSGEVTDEMTAQADAINENMSLARDVVGGFVKDLESGVKPAEALANALGKIADRLLDMALNAIFPNVIAGATGGGGILGSLFGFEAGGVMSGRGPLPLKRYAGGGVANSPQMAIYGEGSRPEAYVPLPDGRAIPVRVRGDMAGRQRVDVAVHPSPMFVTTTQVVAEQAGHRAVASAGDNARRRAGGR